MPRYGMARGATPTPVPPPPPRKGEGDLTDDTAGSDP